MEFTFKAYAQLIDHLRNENWSITDYFGCDACERPAILRHDVDFDLKTEVTEYYKLFYDYDLSDSDYEELVRNALK